ncbi:AAA family ATPase, partial [Dehalococcoidia bacterium]|nr:AAA family ATPase [Dehalococcoidia bacterium]
DRLLARDQATPAMLVKVAQKLVRFHQASRSDEEISRYGDIETIVQNTEENFAQTTKYLKVSLSQEIYDGIKSYATSFIERQTPLFKRRIEEDKIRDCHGDLHSAHICFGDEVYIFDCIEFNDRFRYCDVASEVASDMDKRRKVYDEVFRRAGERLEKGDGAILDATFVTQSLRRRAAEIAAKHHRIFVIMQTSCPQEVSIARILRRTKEDYESNALTEQAYFNNKAKFEAVDLDDFKRLYPNLSIIHFTVDTRYDPPEDWYVTGVEKR